MSQNLYSCILLTLYRWFNECLERNCKVYHFPPGSNPRGIRSLSAGSVCLILAKPRPGAPRHEWFFVGEITVRDVALVRGNEFRAKYANFAVEIPEAPFPRDNEITWIIIFDKLIPYQRFVRLSECSDARASSSGKPLSEWLITGFTLISPEHSRTLIEAIKAKASAQPHETVVEVNHDTLVKELVEIGEWLGFVAKREDPTPDNLYRLDVTWRDFESHSPLKAFEVDVRGDIDKALVRLKHAWDVWRCTQLYLVVSDERRADRARQLVEPRIRGAFASLRGRLVILGWEDVHELYTKLKDHSELLKRLSDRSS